MVYSNEDRRCLVWLFESLLMLELVARAGRRHKALQSEDKNRRTDSAPSSVVQSQMGVLTVQVETWSIFAALKAFGVPRTAGLCIC